MNESFIILIFTNLGSGAANCTVDVVFFNTH